MIKSKGYDKRKKSQIMESYKKKKNEKLKQENKAIG